MQDLENIFDVEATQEAIKAIEELTEKILKELDQDNKGE